MDVAERVRELAAPVVTAEGLELYDVEFDAGTLRITVDKSADEPKGLDVDVIGEISQRLSHMLDEDDVVSDKRYLLEVSSPGIERRLRLPQHFQANTGSNVRVKTKRPVEGSRRFEARLVSADDKGADFDRGADLETLRLEYGAIENCRIAYDWSTALAGRGNTPTKGSSEAPDSRTSSRTNDDEKATAR